MVQPDSAQMTIQHGACREHAGKLRLQRDTQNIQRLATVWTVRGSNFGGSEIFRACSDRPWGPPSLLYKGYRVSFLGGKAVGTWR